MIGSFWGSLSSGRLFGLTAALAFLLFIFTMPADLTWAFGSADGAELMTAAATLGVPHPPGYPTFVLLGYLLFKAPLPLAIPLRFHLLSAAAMAAACATVPLLARHLAPSITNRTALTAGLLAATSSLVWQQAIVIEVYALNAFFVMGVVWLLITGQRAIWVGLAAGLAVTTHLTSLLLLPFLLVSIPVRHWAAVGGGFLIGSLPWLALPWLAQGDSPVVWGDPTTVQGWLWLVSGRLYRPNVFGINSSGLFDRVKDWLPILLTQLAGLWLIAPLLALKNLFSPHPKKQSIHLSSHHLPIWGTIGLYTLYACGYRSADAQVLLVPATLLGAVVVAPLLEKLKVYGILLPLLLIGLHLNGIFEAKSVDIRHPTLDLLNSLPEDTLIITDGQDQTIFTLWYFHYVEGVRRDLDIVDENLLAFSWYRQRLTRSTTNLYPLNEDNLSLLITTQQQFRPVCRVSLAPYQSICQKNESNR